MPEIEAFDFVPYTQNGEKKKILDGREWTHVEYPVYSPALITLFHVVKDVNAYEVLPEDPPETEAPLVLRDERSIASATVAQLLRYFSLCVREEKFCDGHIGNEFDRGRIASALRRLSELQHTSSA